MDRRKLNIIKMMKISEKNKLILMVACAIIFLMAFLSSCSEDELPEVVEEPEVVLTEEQMLERDYKSTPDRIINRDYVLSNYGNLTTFFHDKSDNTKYLKYKSKEIVSSTQTGISTEVTKHILFTLNERDEVTDITIVYLDIF
jgi:hypothetical protein